MATNKTFLAFKTVRYIIIYQLYNHVCAHVTVWCMGIEKKPVGIENVRLHIRRLLCFVHVRKTKYNDSGRGRYGPLPSTQRGSNRWLLCRTNTTRRFGRPFEWIWGRVEKERIKRQTRGFYIISTSVCVQMIFRYCVCTARKQTKMHRKYYQ